MSAKYDIYQDGNYIETVEATDLDKAFEEAKDFIATGEWKTPGTVRVSMSEAGKPDYIRDAQVEKIIDSEE